MPKFAAVMGKSGTNRIVSVDAETKDAARKEITRQLMTNAQRRKIWKQWQESGAVIVSQDLEEEISEAEASFDEALANARIRAKLQALLTELALRGTRTGPIPESAPVFYAIDDAREALQACERRTNR